MSQINKTVCDGPKCIEERNDDFVSVKNWMTVEFQYPVNASMVKEFDFCSFECFVSFGNGGGTCSMT